MYKNLLDIKARKRNQILLYCSMVLFFVLIILTITIWLRTGEVGVFYLLVTMSIFTFMFYLAEWRGKSNMFIKISTYIKQESANQTIVKLYKDHLRSIDRSSFKNVGFNQTNVFVEVVPNEYAEYWFFIREDSYQFIIEFNDNIAKYYYGDINVDEQDIDDEWVILDYNHLHNLSNSELYTYIFNTYSSCIRNQE